MDIRQPHASKRVLLFGDSCVDKFHYGVCDRMSPEAPVPVFKHVETKSTPGMSLNVKENIEAFGVVVDVVTNDREITKERFVDIKSKQHLMRADYGESVESKPIDTSIISTLDFKKYDAIVISDYDKGFLNPDSIVKIIDISKSCGKKVFADSKKNDLSIFENCILKINEREYKQNSALPMTSEIIITLGSRGAIYNGFLAPATPVEVCDVSGAGDTFLSSVVYHHLQGMNLKICTAQAVKYSTFVVQRSGTYPLTVKDVSGLRNE